ncbi:DUF3572 domain-containing protein [Flexibacterium corallicola]|uniref:DUF3572 domain-containing protein n=1 Tax=Flexibacterium corallicola TaxID=3037259 RepID=UPI00286EC4B8|nr:DUF3572 domain-containing protein [Pseudovibrio sp. M1P-2-3]
MFEGKPASITHESAEELAVNALSFLAQDIEALGRFLSLAGIGPQDLRSYAQEPEFLAGVLEFFMADEQLLLTFTQMQGIRPTMIAAARFELDKAKHPHD